MAAPLAGKPPYATDYPDSYYDSGHQQQQRRQPAARPEDPNARTSAYDVYDTYLDEKHMSGAGGIGMGFMNGDDDDDDEEYNRNLRKEAGPLPSKHAALAAATREPSPPPQYIAAPKPGYAAPIAALNLARPQPAAAPGGRQPPGLSINSEPSQNPFRNPPNPFLDSPSPSIPSSPHPLGAPMTPITPVFARPREHDVKFEVSEKSILRGTAEDKILPKRGEQGDDFWRRFSMVVKEETKKPQKKSTWLEKTQNGTQSLSRWVWLVGILLLLAAAGGIGLGWYISHTEPGHEQPKAVGGSAQEASGSASSVVSTSASASVAVQSSMHVSPTNTVDRRAANPFATPFVQRGQPSWKQKTHKSHRKRLH